MTRPITQEKQKYLRDVIMKLPVFQDDDSMYTKLKDIAEMANNNMLLLIDDAFKEMKLSSAGQRIVALSNSGSWHNLQPLLPITKEHSKLMGGSIQQLRK